MVGSGFNQPIGCVDPTAHAEMLALRAAARAVGNYRLPGASLYVDRRAVPDVRRARSSTPASATVVYGAADPKGGAVRSLLDPATLPLNHRFAVVDGVLADESRAAAAGVLPLAPGLSRPRAEADACQRLRGTGAIGYNRWLSQPRPRPAEARRP